MTPAETGTRTGAQKRPTGAADRPGPQNRRTNRTPLVPPPDSCHRCRTTPGWEPVVLDGVTRLTRCVCWRRRHAAHRSVPPEFRDARWDNWLDQPGSCRALDVARRFAEGQLPQSDLFLSGPVASGKTRLACTVLNHVWRESCARVSVEFVRVPLALYHLQPSAERAENAVFARLAAVRVLVLDDFGAEREAATDFTRRTLLMLSDARSDAGLRTVWTSGRDQADLRHFLGDDRLLVRLVGRARHVQLRAPDPRPRGFSHSGRRGPLARAG